MSKLFQESALNSMATPEQLDQQVKIVKPGAWLGLLAFVFLFISLLVWGIRGNISSTVSLEGIVFPKSGISSILAERQGIVQDVLYQTGDSVQKGDIIATVSDDETLGRIQLLRQKMEGAGKKEQKEYEAELQNLYGQYTENSVIRASNDGMVQNIVSVGQILSAGDEIADIVINNQYTYVPLKTAKRLEVGMEAQISPTYASREEYGYMQGYITSIGSIPVTEESLEKYYGNLEYVADVLPAESSVEVCISVQVDENSDNLFLWSNAKGNTLSVDVGTVCDIRVIVENNSPISLIF